jgi:hypothetical protein
MCAWVLISNFAAAGPFDHAREAGRRETRTPLRDKYEWRFHTFALMTAQRPELAARKRMGGGDAVLEAPDMQGGCFEVDLVPPQVNHFASP